MEEFAFQRALAAIWEFVGAVNRYVDATQPWALAKDPAQRGPARTPVLLHARRVAAVPRASLLDPFLPEAAAKIRARARPDR